MNAPLVLEYIKVVLSWPVVICVLAVAFKKPLNQLVGRITEVTFPGTSLKTTPPPQPTETAADVLPAIVEAATPPPPRTAGVAAGAGGTVGTAVVAASGDAPNEPDNNVLDPYDHLLRERTALQQALFDLNRRFHFERVLQVVYGSQLLLLRHLAQRGTAGDRVVNLHPFYQAYLNATNPAMPRATMDQYLGYLRMSGLIAVGDSDPNSGALITITQTGTEFLSYIDRMYPNWFKQY